jgi:hypothetical protein
VFCIEFNRKEQDWTYYESSKAIGGANEGIVETSNPTPIFDRGLWFDGDDFLSFRNMYMHHTFTLRLWVRTSNGTTIFSVSQREHTAIGMEDWFALYTTGAASTTPSVSYSHGTSSQLTLTGAPGDLPHQDWR